MEETGVQIPYGVSAPFSSLVVWNFSGDRKGGRKQRVKRQGKPQSGLPLGLESKLIPVQERARVGSPGS